MGMVPVESPRRRNVKNANAHLISLFFKPLQNMVLFLNVSQFVIGSGLRGSN